MTHISWHQYFMGVALLTAKRSKDPSTQVGAVIVTPDNKIVSAGYNSMPITKPGYDNDWVFPWTKNDEDMTKNKHTYVVHAEDNAIFNASCSVRGCIMYLTWYPCNECAKSIVQSGISKLVYLHRNTSERYALSMIASDKILEYGGVVVEKYVGEKIFVNLDF